MEAIFIALIDYYRHLKLQGDVVLAYTLFTLIIDLFMFAIYFSLETMIHCILALGIRGLRAALGASFLSWFYVRYLSLFGSMFFRIFGGSFFFVFAFQLFFTIIKNFDSYTDARGIFYFCISIHAINFTLVSCLLYPRWLVRQVYQRFVPITSKDREAAVSYLLKKRYNLSQQDFYFYIRQFGIENQLHAQFKELKQKEEAADRAKAQEQET
jgi:hypothetical protein